PGARRRGGRRHAVAAGGVRRRRLPRRPRPGRAVERRQRGADAGRAPGGDRRGAAAPPALSHRTDESESTWSMVGVGHRLPRAYAALAEVRAAKVAFGVLLAAGL